MRLASKPTAPRRRRPPRRGAAARGAAARGAEAATHAAYARQLEKKEMTVPKLKKLLQERNLD